MRRDPTLAEAILWNALRRRHLGVRFRRQEPIGPFIADFVCRSHRVVVELDGASHDDLARDQARDTWLTRNGWFVLRFDNEDVLGDFEGVLRIIELALEAPHRVADPRNIEG